MPATENFGVFRDLLDTLDTTTTAIKSLAVLIEHAFRSGDDLSNEANGVYALFDQQCHDLESLRRALREAHDETMLKKLEIRDPEKIAELAGVPQYLSNRVVSIATGIYIGSPIPPRTENDHAQA